MRSNIREKKFRASVTEDFMNLILDRIEFTLGCKISGKQPLKKMMRGLLPEHDDFVKLKSKNRSSREAFFSEINNIFLHFDRYGDNISTLVDRNVRFDVFDEPRYDDAYNAVKKEVERKFKNNSSLASVIYVELVRNLKKITKNKGTTVSRGLRFEDECERELKASGFSIDRTSITGDFGIDVIARKDAMSCGIQCKNYSKPVGVSAVQEVESGRKY